MPPRPREWARRPPELKSYVAMCILARMRGCAVGTFMKNGPNNRIVRIALFIVLGIYAINCVIARVP